MTNLFKSMLSSFGVALLLNNPVQAKDVAKPAAAAPEYMALPAQSPNV